MKLKSIIVVLLIGIVFISCNKNDDDNQDNNQNIPNSVFDTGSLINTNLPQYNQLQFPNNYVILNNNYGINGVVLYHAGNNNFNAFELSDPNHQLNTCSTLTVSGIEASCSCDDGNSYEILNGERLDGTTGQFSLKRYFVEVSGTIIRVYNN